MFNIKEIKKISHNLDPILRIGKKGLTDEIIEEIKTLLKAKKIIKIKINKSIIDEINKKEIAILLTEKTNSMIIEIIGNNFVLLSKGKNGNRNQL